MCDAGSQLDHLKLVARRLADGRVVPFLGAGVNLCDRPAGAPWQSGKYLPNGAELANQLASDYGYPPGELQELVRVSQYVSTVVGSGPLYVSLRSVLDVDYPPTSLHQFLATLPARMRDKGYSGRAVFPLVITTNYDDVLERAYRATGERVDVVTYVADGVQRGTFIHHPAGQDQIIIDRPNEYRGIPLGVRPVIVKMHGAIDRGNADGDSYVITEDHYIEYLTRTDLATLLPVQIGMALRQSHFLFLGYSLADWNLRVLLHRIWGQQKLSWKSWAIQLNPKQLDQKFWAARDVEVLDMVLSGYIAGLAAQITALPHSSNAATADAPA
jgi:SIR2-like domain